VRYPDRVECRAAAARSAGFSLIELLIVLTIIGILATMALPQFWDATDRAKESVLREDLFVMRDALDQFYADRGHYPDELEELVEAGYLRRLPVDPITNASDTWVVTLIDWELLSEGEEPGIWDVHSGAPGTGLDGTEYREW
jgi:general secretion pathway protein G